MTEERKQQLVSIYAFLKSRELNPEKYGEVEDPENEEALLESIIKANKNLKESTSNKDYEMMGKDIKQLQSLIDKLEQLQSQNTKDKENNNNTNTTINL